MVMTFLSRILCVAGALLLVVSPGLAAEAGPFHEEASPNFAVRPAADPSVPAASNTLACQPYCDHSCPRFYVMAEALFLQLDHPVSQTMVINQNTGMALVDTQDLTFDAEAGPRLTLGCPLGACGAVELSYFGLHHWNVAATATGEGDLSLPGDIGGAVQNFFRDADRMDVNYTAEINSAELNYVREIGCNGLSLLAGFRFVRLDESFNIRSTGELSGISDYGISTKNNLFGAQIGGRWRWERDCVGLEFVSKIGIFGNGAQQHTFLGDTGERLTDGQFSTAADGLFVLRDSTTRGSRVAVLGEFGVSAIVRLYCGLYARAGYNVIYIDGVARAPDQLDFTDTATSGTALLFRQGAFMHGANVGLEYRW
jgi:hypothetical protein